LIAVLYVIKASQGESKPLLISARIVPTLMRLIFSKPLASLAEIWPCYG
jgi:hypothetical protein